MKIEKKIQVDENPWVYSLKVVTNELNLKACFFLFCGLCFKIVYEGNMYRNQASLWKDRWVWMFETSASITITFESHEA